MFNRFEIMDLGQQEYRERLQKEREEKGCCELCGSVLGVKWYTPILRDLKKWDPFKMEEDPNRKRFICEKCSQELLKEYKISISTNCDSVQYISYSTGGPYISGVKVHNTKNTGCL